jgi:RecA/RadA recombinase
VLTVDEAMKLPPLDWLVKGLLPRRGVAAIYGPSGSGKSFLVLDLMSAVSAGRPWFGYGTKAAEVLYVMLEGEAGLSVRLQALEKAGKPPSDGFKVLTDPFGFADEADVLGLAAVVPSGAVVVIDTLNRAAPGLDENSSKDMGVILAGAKALQTAIDGLVVIVHHTGKDSTKGARGHSSLIGALDAAVEVEKVTRSDGASTRYWSVAKSKDGEDGKRHAFKLVRQVLGKDEDGDEVTSCSVAPDTAAVFAAKSEPKTANQKLVFDAIKAALAQSADTGKGGSPAGTQCLRWEVAMAVGEASLPSSTPSKRRAVTRAIASLVQGKLLTTKPDGGVVWYWR